MEYSNKVKHIAMLIYDFLSEEEIDQLLDILTPEDNETDDIADVVEVLLKGEELEMDNETIDELEEYLLENYKKFHLEVVNNKVRLRIF